MNWFKILAHGADFDVDGFVNSSRLRPSKVWHLGERGNGFRSRPTSGLEIALGDGPALEVMDQATIAARYLEEHESELQALAAYPGLDTFVLFLHRRVEIDPSTIGFSIECYPRLVYFAVRAGLSISTYVELTRADSEGFVGRS